MKKTLLTLTCLCTAALSLTACGGGQQKTTETSADTTVEATTVETETATEVPAVSLSGTTYVEPNTGERYTFEDSTLTHTIMPYCGDSLESLDAQAPPEISKYNYTMDSSKLTYSDYVYDYILNDAGDLELTKDDQTIVFKKKTTDKLEYPSDIMGKYFVADNKEICFLNADSMTFIVDGVPEPGSWRYTLNGDEMRMYVISSDNDYYMPFSLNENCFTLGTLEYVYTGDMDVPITDVTQ